MTTRTRTKRRSAESANNLPPRRLFTVDEYERMIEVGVLRSGERVELINGEIVCMAAMGTPHVATISRLQERFWARLPSSAMLRIQAPVRLPPGAEPEPDLAIVPRRDDFYASVHPGPGDVLLAIEVSDTTLAYDRGTKLPMYAAAGIPETWIWDLPHNQVWVCRSPEGGVYRDITAHGRDETIAPLAFPDLMLAVGEMLG